MYPTSSLIKRVITGIVLSALSGAMLILSFHPYNQWYLAFIALIPMLISQHRIFPEKASGLAQGIGVGGWLFVFLTGMFAGNSGGIVIEIIVAVIVFIQLFTVPAVITFHKQTSYKWFILQGVTDWVGFEMVRSFIPPINTHAFIAQTMYTQPWILQPISIFSIYGLGSLIVLVNYSLAQLFISVFDQKSQQIEKPVIPMDRAKKWIFIATASLAVWMGISVVMLNINTKGYSRVIRVAAIQHNYQIPGHLDTKESQPERLDVLSDYTRQAAREGARLIVWPELGLGFDPQAEYTEKFISLARETNAYILIGYGLDTSAGYRNEMVMITPGGEFTEVYGKNHPTSPGEPRIISSGVYPVFDTEIGRIATLICNDIHWTETSRKLARNGAQLIAEPTFEIAGIALEQVAQGVLRAVENRVAIVKADTAFAAAVVDPNGRIIAMRDGSPDGAAFSLVADVPLGNPPTVLTYLGDWMGWVNLVGLIFFMVYQEKIKRRYAGGAGN